MLLRKFGGLRLRKTYDKLQPQIEAQMRNIYDRTPLIYTHLFNSVRTTSLTAYIRIVPSLLLPCYLLSQKCNLHSF